VNTPGAGPILDRRVHAAERCVGQERQVRPQPLWRRVFLPPEGGVPGAWRLVQDPGVPERRVHAAETFALPDQKSRKPVHPPRFARLWKRRPERFVGREDSEFLTRVGAMKLGGTSAASANSRVMGPAQTGRTSQIRASRRLPSSPSRAVSPGVSARLSRWISLRSRRARLLCDESDLPLSSVTGKWKGRQCGPTDVGHPENNAC
jgi:hypothetical protein